MEKVKQVWFDIGGMKGSMTGLIIELEDGTLLAHQSTDPIMPFEKYTPPNSL